MGDEVKNAGILALEARGFTVDVLSSINYKDSEGNCRQDDYYAVTDADGNDVPEECGFYDQAGVKIKDILPP